MTCPTCNHTESDVLETRGDRRRRKCKRCGHRWTTFEIAEAEVDRLRTLEAKARELAAAVESE